MSKNTILWSLALSMLVLSLGNYVAAQSWLLIPDPINNYTLQGITVPLSLDSMVVNSNQMKNIGGVSADLYYDPHLLSNPCITPCRQGGIANGYVIKPGVYRFLIYASPMADIVNTELIYNNNDYYNTYMMANICFHVNDTSIKGMNTITFGNVMVSDQNSNPYSNVSFGTITLKLNYAAARDWTLYE